MAKVTTQQAAQDIAAHIAQCGGNYRAWYAGVAKDPRQRLFNDHAVKEKGDAWIHRELGTDDAARSVEQHLLQQGCRGGPGGGGQGTRFVYAYRMAQHTRQ
jgi:hypothetical protein